MTGRTLAIARWRALDRAGEDTCRLAQASHGWLLMGHARFQDNNGWAALDYVVRCNENWSTLSADIAGLHEGREVSLRLECSDGRWLLNYQAQSQVDGARDLDLSFTPATNLMPIQRLLARHGPELKTSAAWLQYPECELTRLDQSYSTSEPGEIVTYAADQTGFSTQLCVDHSGFVTLYPGLWEGEVTHAAV